DLARARENRVAGRRRIDRLALRPDGPGANRAHLSDDEICVSALYGTPDEVARMMETLREAGAEYVLLNSAGGRPTLRRFARELMPAFASEGGFAPLPTLRGPSARFAASPEDPMARAKPALEPR